MKTILLFFCSLLSCLLTVAQVLPASPWVWMKGDNTINSPGQYGTLRTESAANKPGARNASATWKDQNGNLWLFGGSGFNSSTQGYLNDLWKYNTATGNWTWMKGDNAVNSAASFGTQELASETNKPGATYSPVSWTDASGNLWLFGGFGFSSSSMGLLNCLWKYNTQTHQWTWMKGSQLTDVTGTYGTKGIAATLNNPGARYGSQAWTDNAGNLWLFGGYGYSSSSFGMLNDLWKYNTATNQWTWIKGDNSAEQKAVYGTKAVSHSANKPGARYASSSWIDQAGMVWLFGGYGYDETYSGNLNDMWRYNPQTNEWTWMNGDKLRDQKAVFGTQGQIAIGNKPGSRYVGSSWTDQNGELLMFGGYGFDAVNSGYLNDLWKYNTVSNAWTWVKGGNTVDQRGIYGEIGTADPANKSGARTGSVSWSDGNGNLWMFGGEGYDASGSGILNDLWRISSNQSVLPLQLLNFDAVMANKQALLQWRSEHEINFSHFEVQRSVDGKQFSSIRTITGSGQDAKKEYTYTDRDFGSAETIFYRLKMVDNNQKYTYSKVIRFDTKSLTTGIHSFPNPARNSLTISFDQKREGIATVSIIDMKGTLIKKEVRNLTTGKASLIIDVRSLPAATYFITVTNAEGIQQQAFLKQ